MPDNSHLIEHMSLIHDRMTHHHSILWEEEKHYSWWVYIIIAGLVWVYAQPNINSDASKLFLITAGCLFGIWLSVSALVAIYKESKYLFEARQYYARSLIALKLNTEKVCDKLLVEEDDCKYEDMQCVRLRANKLDSGIRSFFKYNFILTSVLFIAFLVFSYWTLLRC